MQFVSCNYWFLYFHSISLDMSSKFGPTPFIFKYTYVGLRVCVYNYIVISYLSNVIVLKNLKLKIFVDVDVLGSFWLMPMMLIYWEEVYIL